jgi:formylglycine-generating enzyme required for sulfatase activity
MRNISYVSYTLGESGALFKFGQSYNVTRGGSWSVNLDGLRTTLRIPRQPGDIGNKDVGFRCVKSDNSW